MNGSSSIEGSCIGGILHELCSLFNCISYPDICIAVPTKCDEHTLSNTRSKCSIIGVADLYCSTVAADTE